MSPHVAALHDDHMQLVWREPFKAEDHVRVIAWTCPYEPIMYELCRAAGQGYIRRTQHGEERTAVHETYRWSVREADAVWRALLNGQAQ